jgi:cysteine synthase
MMNRRKYPLVSACLTPDLTNRFNDLWNLVGNTPLIELQYLYKGRQKSIFVKCEQYNLSGSIKDRAVLYILNKAYLNCQIHPFDTITGFFSNNFSIATAHIAKMLGHAAVIYTAGNKRKHCESLITNEGAEIMRIDEVACGGKSLDYQTGTLKTDEVTAFSPKRFKGLYTMAVHEQTTGREIWRQLEAVNLRPNAFVAGIGSGETFTGIANYLKSVDNNIKFYPVGNFKTLVLNKEDWIAELSTGLMQHTDQETKISEVTCVRRSEAIAIANKLKEQIGISIGITSGANIIGAIKAKEELGTDAVVVTLFFDDGKRCLDDALPEIEASMLDSEIASDISFLGYRSVPKLRQSLIDAYL